MVLMAFAGVSATMLGLKSILFTLLSLLTAMEPTDPTIRVSSERFVEEFIDGILSLSPEQLQTSNILFAQENQPSSLLEYLSPDHITAVCKSVFDPGNGMFELLGRNSHLLHIKPLTEESEESFFSRFNFVQRYLNMSMRFHWELPSSFSRLFLVPFNQRPTKNILNQFKFVGRLLGLAIKYHWELPVAFSRLFFKTLLPNECTITLDDIGEFDEPLQISIQKVFSIEDVKSLSLDFTVFAGNGIVELIPDGFNILVTNENVDAYVNLLIGMFRSWGRQQQVQTILSGIVDVLGEEFLNNMDWQKLSLGIRSCQPPLNLDEWIDRFSFLNCNIHTPEVQYFIQYLRDLPLSGQMHVFGKLTGIARLPVSGFKSAIDFTADVRWKHIIMYSPAQTGIDVNQAQRVLALPTVASPANMKILMDAALGLEEDI